MNKENNMSYLKVKKTLPNSDGRVQHITPESAGWTHVGFQLFNLKQSSVLNRKTHNKEICLVLMTGSATIKIGKQLFENLISRDSVFEGYPVAVYIPNDSQFEVIAGENCSLAICSAPGKGTYPARLIKPEDMSKETRGKGANIRHVCNILPDTADADSLLVVEVITPSGNSSSYPPHKHDVNNLPTETQLEETYYHRLNPPQGFAFQRVYTDDRSLDESMCIEDGDVVMVPKGYHPVVVPHGYDLYYLNVMAGPIREWHFNNDPDHDWIVNPTS